MGQTTKRIWNTVGIAVEFWAVYGFVDAWLSGDAIVLGTFLASTSLAMQSYAALAVGVGVFLFLWNRDSFLRWRQERNAQKPEAVFRRLYEPIAREFELIEQEREYPHTLSRTQASKSAQREVLRFALLKCGIETPSPAKDSDETWYGFIANLVPLSLHRRLEEARALGLRFVRS